MTETPTAVYRLYDAAGYLLYVGSSGDPTRRWREHRKEMFWWREVARHERQWYASERLARAAEGEAICWEQARYNKGEPGPVLPSGVPRQPHGARIAYQCRELRPAFRREWFMWRLHLQDGIETEREMLHRIVLLLLRARLANLRRGEPLPNQRP
ncbi:GIY-YIG nuclease family protein [Streptomyces sp. NPDC001502]|uniref:GIY-YIG nuclease family protein n=1 Tax=Streptomyces sp. NPDC001502 TaxID=3364578 RepID=UPI0036930C28